MSKLERIVIKGEIELLEIKMEFINKKIAELKQKLEKDKR